MDRAIAHHQAMMRGLALVARYWISRAKAYLGTDGEIINEAAMSMCLRYASEKLDRLLIEKTALEKLTDEKHLRRFTMDLFRSHAVVEPEAEWTTKPSSK